MSAFYLFGKPDERLKLKKFSASSSGTKATIRIEIETQDMSMLGYALESLGQVQQGQNAKPLALPKPGGGQ